jgi:hypothetical protein
MKKLTYKRKLYLDRRARHLSFSGCRRRAGIDWLQDEYSGLRRRVKVYAPEIFLIRSDENRKHFHDFVLDIELALRAGQNVVIDFSKTKAMHACGTLTFLAHLDVWLHKYPLRISATYPKVDVVEQVLQHFGQLQRLGLAPRKEITHEHVRFWHFISGTAVTAATYRALTASVSGSIEHPQAALFADCLNEAVTNAVNHAYKFETPELPPEEMRKWWMFSEPREDKLCVAIYDIGVSIPRSLLRKPEWQDYALRGLKDSRLIGSAVTSDRTSTKLVHRGKGLPEMLEFSSELSKGGLSIWSRDGAWIYHAGDGRRQTVNLHSPLRGTLVLWEIPFRKER